MVEASCNRCGKSATGETFEDAESKIICGLKLKGDGPCNENLLERRCNGCPAYKAVRVSEEEGRIMIGFVSNQPRTERTQNSKKAGKGNQF